MKREFAMMMKAQSGWDIGVGTKRSTRSPQVSQNKDGNVKDSAKKRKKEVKNGESNEDLVNSKDENVVLMSEDLSKSKEVGVGEELEGGNVVLMNEELPKSKVVGVEELEGGDGGDKSGENVVMVSDELSNSKVFGEELEENVVLMSEDLPSSKVEVGGEELEELERDGIVKRDENVVLMNEELSKSKVVVEELESDGGVKMDGNVVLLSDELSKTKVVVGEEELESGDGGVKGAENVVPMSDDLAKSKVVGGEEELEGDGGVKRGENVVLLSEEEEPKSDVVDCTSEDEKKEKMDVDVVGCGEEGNAKTEMDKTAKANDGFDEAMADVVVPELAVTAQGDGEDEQKCGDGGKSEMGKTGKASDCVVGAMPEVVPELAVTIEGGEEDVQKCGDDTMAEVAKTGKTSDCIVGAMPEIVPELAVTAEDDGKDEQKVLLQTPARRFTRSALKIEGDAKVSQCDTVKVDEVHETDPAGTMSAPAKLELKMSKKVALNKNPSKLKDLLETGLLEGLTVRYIRGSKGRGRPAKGLHGEIRGLGILCFCDNCRGTSVVTPNQFELHAHSANKRPPEYIYLDNGKSLRDVLSLCKDVPSDELEIVIKNAIGTADANLVASASKTAQEIKSTSGQSSEASSRPTSSVSATKLTDRMPSGSGSHSKAHGKLTRKDLRMHKLVFEDDALPDGTALAYYVRGQKLLEGYKKGHGIYCLCCDTEVSPSQFEAHAGCASRRKPYLYIYTSNGVSLHELSIKLSKERRSSAEENDDLCSICADGGDLLCCDNCPRAFHAECIFLPSIPSGTWYCKYCENMFAKERFVENNANAIAAGRVAGIDAIEQITKRCIRIVETLETEVTVCVLCRDKDFSKSGFGPRTVIICDQCEKEYHVGCLKEHNIDDLQELPKDKWFCCTDCNRIHFALEKLVSDGEQNIPESLLKVLKEKNEGKDPENNSTLDIKWRLLSGKMSSEETRVWLSSAVSIFHEQFDPIADASTSRLDLIPHMVYGRNFKDQDYGGMFCAILLVNSLVVSAGIIRIFGKEVAELPLVATSAKCQGQGYFQSLFSCMENLLQSLNVEKLVLPSAEEAKSIWTNRFNFTKITEEQLKDYRKNYQMMVFSGTSMLQKQVGGSQCDNY